MRIIMLSCVQIHSPDVPDLTVVDLPGTTTIPMKNQPTSIVEDLQSMALHYISDANSIILAVTPANADVANSQALQLASKVDPSHNRTIGVLTKIDLMDRGTDAAAILNNKKYPLKLGWVGVVNRSQQDIDGNKTLNDAKSAEKAYFHGSPESPYRCLSPACPRLARQSPLWYPSLT
jgi:dynamin 1-like protein